MLHAVFVRSPHPYAVIKSVDRSAALALDGVHAVITAEDFGDGIKPIPNTHAYPGQRATPFYPLAIDRARYVGEPVAMVVADTQYLAEDGRDLVLVEWEVLPSVGNTDRALEPDAPTVYEEWPDNVVGLHEAEMGDVDAAFEAADVVVTSDLSYQRVFACPLECRGSVGHWEAQSGQVSLWTSSQILHITRDLLATVIGHPEHKVRVFVPRIGGAFGGKFHFYAEDAAVVLASKVVGRPVKWIEDRLESFTGMVHARDQKAEVQMAATREGKILGVKADIVGDLGAALHTTGSGPIWLTSVMMTNVYEIENARVRSRIVATNKTPAGSYRGWGQPEANFFVERTLDLVARELDISPAEIRRRNFIPPEHLPHTGLFHTLDSGDYAASLDRAVAVLEERKWPERIEQMRQEGKTVGIGYGFYTENTALGPSRILNAGGVDQGGYDISRIRVDTDGQVALYTGLCEMGQGLGTALTQVCADQLGVDPSSVRVISGDSASVPYSGYGTGASRGASLGGASAIKACGTIREKVKRIAAHMLEANPDDLEIESGEIFVAGSPESRVTMADVGKAAYTRIIDLPEGEDPGLEATEAFDPPQMAWSFGVNVVVLEVDPQTGMVDFLDYIYVHDCGTVLNPMIVDGQIHGGVAQGIGTALLERLPYNDEGQPLFATFMDYPLPSAVEIPRPHLEHTQTESPNIPGGMKGVGEAGIIGSPTAIAAAIEDALGGRTRFTHLPIQPGDITRAAREGVTA